jgi:hypothetical protein
MLLYHEELEAAWNEYRKAYSTIWVEYWDAIEPNTEAWRAGKLGFEAYGDIAEKLYAEADDKDQALWQDLQAKLAEIKAKYA